MADWRYGGMEDISTYGSDSTLEVGVEGGITRGQFGVPPREIWQILSIWAEFTANVGVTTARELRLIIRDAADDIMYEVSPGVAPDTNMDFLFAPGAADLTAARDTDLVMTPILAGMILGPGWDITVQATADTSDTDGDSDDMVLQLIYASQKVLSTGSGAAQSSDQPANTDSDLS